MFEQTPVIIRWLLGIVTLGFFTLASVIYKWQRQDLQSVHERIDRMDAKFERRHAEQQRVLIRIATNTRSHNDE